MTFPRSCDSSGTCSQGDFSHQLDQVVLLSSSSQKGALRHGALRLSSAYLSFWDSALVAVVLSAFHAIVFISLLVDQAGMLLHVGLLVGQFQSGKDIPMKLISKHPKKHSLFSPFACCSPEKASKGLQACLCVQQKLCPLFFIFFDDYFCLLLSTFLLLFFFFLFSIFPLRDKNYLLHWDALIKAIFWYLVTEVFDVSLTRPWNAQSVHRDRICWTRCFVNEGTQCRSSSWIWNAHDATSVDLGTQMNPVMC